MSGVVVVSVVVSGVVVVSVVVSGVVVVSVVVSGVVVVSVVVSLPSGAKKGVAKTATFGKAVVVDVAIAITMAVIAVVMYTLLILISNNVVHNVFNHMG